MQDLALQVAEVDLVVVDQFQGADARGGEIHGRRRSQTADPDDQRAGVENRLLPGFADRRQANLARVSVPLLLLHPPPLWKYW